MKNKRVTVGITFILFITGSLMMLNFLGPGAGPVQAAEAKYWTCGMHPSVRVSDAEYKKGKTNCPICNMPLIPLVAEEEKPAPQKGQVTEETYYGCGVKEEGHCPKCDEGKPGKECVCGEHSFMLKAKKGLKLQCPVCKKEGLKEIEPEEVKEVVHEENIISRVKLSPRQAELAGVVVTPIEKRHLTKEIRTVGKIAFDPELRIAQEEFLTALQTREKVKESPDPDVINRAGDLLEKSRYRLRLLGMSDGEIKELEIKQAAETSLVLPEDKAWVYAEVYEYELGWIKPGQDAEVAAAAFPGEKFKGIIRSINPVLDPKTRSVRVRLQIDNPQLKLKPEMFVDVKIGSVYAAPDGSHEVLALPKEAVLDTGLRKIVYVDSGNGIFLGKELVLGPEAGVDVDGQRQVFYPVLKGLSGDEMVVTKGNFLIDSQSQLTGGMSVLWGGASEIKKETSGDEGAAAPIQTEHRH